MIATVLEDEDLKQLYVCYNDASYVNVYSESGEFLWAVSTPYLRNVSFELREGQLIIYHNEAYIYDSKDGTFLGLKNAEDLDLDYDWENETTDDFQPGEFYFDTYQVYRAGADGSLETVVARPWWYWVFHFGVCWNVSFIGAVGFGILILLEKRAEVNAVKKKTEVRNEKVRFVLRYLRITCAVHLIYAVLDIIFGFFGGILTIGIIPVAIHFMIIQINLQSKLLYVYKTDDEIKMLDYWHAFAWGSFIVAFLSVAVVVMIAG